MDRKIMTHTQIFLKLLASGRAQNGTPEMSKNDLLIQRLLLKGKLWPIRAQKLGTAVDFKTMIRMHIFLKL